jgi:hypothetical protein
MIRPFDGMPFRSPKVSTTHIYPHHDWVSAYVSLSQSKTPNTSACTLVTDHCAFSWISFCPLMAGMMVSPIA